MSRTITDLTVKSGQGNTKKIITYADGIPGSAFGTNTKMGVGGGVKPVNEILIIGTPMAIQI